MKAQAKAAIASVVVIALALTAVSGVTYSWWTDSESTEIGITTGSFSLADGSYELSYFDGVDSNDVAVSASSGSGPGSSSITNTLAFEVAPPDGKGRDGSRVYTLTYRTGYESSAPVTIKVTASVLNGTGWISDVKATSLTSGSTVIGTGSGYSPGESISADLESSATVREVTVIIQFMVDADSAFNKDPATLKIDTELTSRAAT